MKENNEIQVKRVHLPPAWCGQLCRNAMSEACIEHCAVKRDCSFFEAKPTLKLVDMPRFPETNGMTREEKFTAVTVYLAKVVDHLKGVDDEYTYLARRPNLDRSRSRPLPENFQIKDLLPGVQEGNSSLEDRAKCEDPPDGSSEVAGEASEAA